MTRIVESVRIAADADSLWQEIGQFSAVGNWHPMLAKVESEGECEGCLRTAEGRDGSRQTERLIKLDPERRLYRYRMEATAMPIRDYVGELAVEGNANSTSKVVWSAKFEVTSAADVGAVEAIRAFLRAGLDRLGKLHGECG
jgi:mxaD protein